MSTASGDLSSFGVVHPLAKRSMSTGPNQSTTASTLLDVEVYFPKFPSMSTVTLPDVRVLTPFVVPANVERCPPEENPVIPMKELSSPYLSAKTSCHRMLIHIYIYCLSLLSSFLYHTFSHLFVLML